MKIPKEFFELLLAEPATAMAQLRMVRAVYLVLLPMTGKHAPRIYSRERRRAADGRWFRYCTCGLCGHRTLCRHGAEATERIENHETQHLIEFGVERLRVFLAIRALTTGTAAAQAVCDYPLSDKKARMAFWTRLHEEAKAAKRKSTRGEERGDG